MSWLWICPFVAPLVSFQLIRTVSQGRMPLALTLIGLALLGLLSLYQQSESYPGNPEDVMGTGAACLLLGWVAFTIGAAMVRADRALPPEGTGLLRP